MSFYILLSIFVIYCFCRSVGPLYCVYRGNEKNPFSSLEEFKTIFPRAEDSYSEFSYRYYSYDKSLEFIRYIKFDSFEIKITDIPFSYTKLSDFIWNAKKPSYLDYIREYFFLSNNIINARIGIWSLRQIFFSFHNKKYLKEKYKLHLEQTLSNTLLNKEIDSSLKGRLSVSSSEEGRISLVSKETHLNLN